MKTSYPEIEGTAKDLKFTNQYGKYLISHFNTWHGGVHIEGINKSIQAVLDGRIIAYRFMDNYLDLPKTKSATKEINEEETEEEINYKYSNCFVLIQHDIELTKEEIKEDQTKESKNEIVTFYSLYNHLMPISEIQSLQDEDESKKNNFPSFMGKEQLTVSVKENFEYKKKKREGLNARTLNSNSKIDWRDDSTKAVVIPFGKTVKKDLDAEGALIKKGNYAKVTFTDENGDFYNDIYINIGLTKTRKYPRVKDLGDSFEIIIKEDNEIWIDKSSVPEDKKNLEGARIRNIPETPKQNKDSTIVDIIEHGKPVTIKEKKDNGWYVIEGFEGYSAKSNFEVKVSFDDENITKGDIVKCDIPVKSGDHIGYTGLLTNEQNTGYAACQLDIFMEDGATDFISNKFGAGDTVKDLRFVTLPKDTELEQNIEIDVNLRKHLPVKVIETKDIYAKIKIESEIKRIIPVAGNIYTPNVGSADGKYKGYKEHPKGYDYINFDSVNTHFDNLLDKEQSRLIWVSTPTGGLTREVKFKPKEAGKTYWVKIADLDKTAEVVQTKRTITRLKTVQDYPTTADFILNRWTDNVITEEITIPVIKNTVVKKNELTKLSKDITKAFVIAPQKENNKSQKLGKEAIAELIPSTELKGTSVENEYLKVSCTYIYDSKEFTQKGWIKNNVEKFSAFNWDKFGFKIFDGGNEYIYDIKGLRDFEENGSEFIEKLLDNLDVIKDGILDKDELNFACGIPEIQEEMAKMICSHKMEWSYTPDEIAGEVTKIYDYLISKQPEDAQSELEQLKEDKLTVHKAQVENLMFWNKLKKKTFAPKETEEDKEYKQKKQKITKKYSPLLNDPKTVEGDSKIAMDAELDALDKKYKKEKYAPEPPKFPTKENVHHFHPIAFINQLKLMFPQGKAEGNYEAKIRAFLRLIKQFEGVPGENGYTTFFGGSQFTDTTTHPEKPIYWYTKADGTKVHSTAAGAYQIMKVTWWDYNGEVVAKDENGKKYKTGKKNPKRNFVKKYGIADFSAKSQDEFCIALLKHARPPRGEQKGLLNDLLNGFVTKAIEEYAAHTWASFTPGRYDNQGPMKGLTKKGEIKEAIHNARVKQWEAYDKYLAEELAGQSDLHLEPGFLKKFGIKEPEAQELIEGKKEGLDLNKAIEGLNKRAGAMDTSVGYCAKYVRWALESGGMNTDGRPRSAKDYGPFLLKKGFKEVPRGDDKVGDIAVIESFTNNPHGHIEMYNGENWVSDFVQRTFYPGQSYRDAEPNYKIYRWE